MCKRVMVPLKRILKIWTPDSGARTRKIKTYIGFAHRFLHGNVMINSGINALYKLMILSEFAKYLIAV